MIRGRGTAKGFIAPTVLTVILVVFAGQSSGLAQDEEGVPTEAVEANQAVTEVEEAMEKVEEEIEEGLPAEFTIKFGDTYDWLRLTSGEWLKGELKRMREDDIEFDSDKLDLLEFDWEKVDQLHSPRVNTYVFDGKVDVVGRGVVTKDQVLVETAEGVQSYPRSTLLSIVQGEPRERNWWSTRLSAGFSGSAGNTSQGQFNGHWDLRRADQRTRSDLSYDGTFGFANDVHTVNRHVGTLDVKLYISRRFFLPIARRSRSASPRLYPAIFWAICST